MPTIRLNNFQGIIPGRTYRLNTGNVAEVAKNVKLQKGDLRAFNSTLFVNTPTKVGTKLAIFKWGSNTWFHWLTDVNVVKGPIAGDTLERVYYTGDSEPRMTYSPLAITGGGSDYPLGYRTLGLPAPSAACTAALGAGGGCDAALEEARIYVYTFVSATGEESAPSPASNTVSACPGQTVNLSSVGTTPPGGGTHEVAKRYIYRSVTASSGATVYKYVGAINDAVTTTYADAALTEDLITIIKSTDWIPPPQNMHSIVSMPNGIHAGLSNNELCFCEPYQPHAYPDKYKLSLDYPGVGLGAFGGFVAVLTKGHPYIAYGTHPKTMKLEKVSANQACVSKRSIATWGDGVLYASPDGLVYIGADGVRIVTDGYMTRDDWQALKPSSIVGAVHDNRYYGFYDTGAVQKGFIFDPTQGGRAWVDLDTYATAVFSDLEADALYLQVGNNIVQWDAGGSSISMTYRSNKVRTAVPLNMACCQVLAEDYTNVNVKIFADGAQKHTTPVSSDTPFWLPGGYLGSEWQVEVTGDGKVNEVVLATSIDGLGVV